MSLCLFVLCNKYKTKGLFFIIVLLVGCGEDSWGIVWLILLESCLLLMCLIKFTCFSQKISFPSFVMSFHLCFLFMITKRKIVIHNCVVFSFLVRIWYQLFRWKLTRIIYAFTWFITIIARERRSNKIK